MDRNLSPLPRRAYRERVYERYASVHMPVWLESDARSDAIWARATLQRLRDWLPESRAAKWLDLGCGAGHLMRALRDSGYSNVLGVDVSPEAIFLARSRGLEVVQADLRDYLRDCIEIFDIISAADVIEHFGKDEILEVLDLARQRLRPGGTLVLQTPNALSPWAAHYRYRDLTHELIFSPESITSTLHLVGFASVLVREVEPYVHGLRSAVRWFCWKFIWGCCAAWNLAETGTLNGGVYTRNMIVRAMKE